MENRAMENRAMENLEEDSNPNKNQRGIREPKDSLSDLQLLILWNKSVELKENHVSKMIKVQEIGYLLEMQGIKINNRLNRNIQ
jgi:hypothetical protein